MCGTFPVESDHNSRHGVRQRTKAAFGRDSAGLQLGIALANARARMGPQAVPIVGSSRGRWHDVRVATNRGRHESTPRPDDITQGGTPRSASLDATGRRYLKVNISKSAFRQHLINPYLEKNNTIKHRNPTNKHTIVDFNCAKNLRPRS